MARSRIRYVWAAALFSVALLFGGAEEISSPIATADMAASTPRWTVEHVSPVLGRSTDLTAVSCIDAT